MFDSLSLYTRTCTRRTENLGDKLCEQLRDKAQTFDSISLTIDESTNVSDTAQLLIFVRGIDQNFCLRRACENVQFERYNYGRRFISPFLTSSGFTAIKLGKVNKSHYQWRPEHERSKQRCCWENHQQSERLWIYCAIDFSLYCLSRSIVLQGYIQERNNEYYNILC
ncbi:General transcription factor II-I repeat domain-containing protein 2 [Eumeta japonica]|uniref:General transcription factor II-I repeat domain-containing protein 2 n=1 Tax=Eumeta variegata TaxID=151549 RepID=A0A4C1XLC1_EUMVA|nr:General transcription factor II-I repeat domain-containing protein 2 [Eumeta japonica]